MKHYIGDGKITEEMTPSLPHLILSYSTQVERHQDDQEITLLPNPVKQMESSVCIIVIHGFSFQVAEEEFKIEARLHYKDFDAWSPWVSSDSPVGQNMFRFFFIHSSFSEARGIGKRDGLPAGDHRRRRGGLRLAHHPRRHRRPQAEEVPEEV